MSSMHRRGPQKRLLQVAATLVTVLTAAGCDTLLEVDLPGSIAASTLEDPALANLMERSVITAYECALSEYMGATAMFGSEIIVASNNSSRDHQHNRIPSNVENWGATGSCSEQSRTTFSPGGAVYQAMALGRDVTAQFEAFTDAQVIGRVRKLAVTSIYEGYAITLLGEGYCGAVLEPFGASLTRKQTLQKAEEWFTKGLQFATTANDATLKNLAYLGRARVRLNLSTLGEAAKRAEAAADAKMIPSGFRVDATRAAGIRQNRTYQETWITRDISINPQFYNMTVRIADGRLTQNDAAGVGVADPRVVVKDQGFKGVDGVTPSWFPVNKVNTVGAPIRMASWQEAQLIIAEAELGQSALDRINALRALSNLPLYQPANVNDANAMLDAVIMERKRELWLEGRWINDMIRFKDRTSQLYPTEFQTLWMEGMTHQNITTYRPQYCLPLLTREVENNPNATLMESL